MKANIVNSFAAGLLISAGVCGAVYFSGSSKGENNSKKATALTEEEMKTNLANSGYVILTNAEWEKQLTAIEEQKKEATTDKAKEETAKEEQPKKDAEVVSRTIVNVASGMTSIDVGNALEQGKILDDAMTFFHEVEKRGLSNELKPGTFEVDSNMTMDEIISVIFK
ncbi:hypothetical protein EKG37_16535 [Robertmurraya yapensis]|uniref:Endolytic transglycosylase MltG n=2 Tax=Bacillaceae TaxID=186817 RepID=A0A3S0L7K8_9BACI|nr:hypothetical protein [Bacillus yapensis]RTR28822.1 hypothetical protein EKG37_16535 [Bacillus yapensis]TKS94680.1 endolytic transglycosylase MltG [Bacillus yapensis]